MSREAEEEERNHPNKRLEDNGSLDDNCLGHQILHFLLIFTSWVCLPSHLTVTVSFSAHSQQPGGIWQMKNEKDKEKDFENQSREIDDTLWLTRLFVVRVCLREREREYQVEDMAGIKMEQKTAIGVFRCRV